MDNFFQRVVVDGICTTVGYLVFTERTVGCVDIDFTKLVNAAI